MKRNIVLLGMVSAVLMGLYIVRIRAADGSSFQKYEYAAVRWDGREHTKLIRPSGKVESLRALLERMPRPEGIEDRAYYMMGAINGLAREGYELTAFSGDIAIMKRSLVKD